MGKSNRVMSISADDAKAGQQDHVLRYILAVSLTMAIAIQSSIWIIYTS